MTVVSLDATHLRSWIGSSQDAVDMITPALVERFCAIFDLPLESIGAEAPPGIHWCLSPPIASSADLGPDGHPERGRFLPPVPLPRRMWAGGELVFHHRLRVRARSGAPP